MVRQWPEADLAQPRLTSHRRVADLVARISRSQAAQEMHAEMRKQIVSYERLSPEMSEAEVLETCRRSLRLWFQWLHSGGAPPAEEVRAVRAAVRARAEEGIPLEDVLHAYRIGGRLGWQLLRRHATPAEQDVLLDAADLLMLFLDTLSEIVTETYLGKRELLVSEEERDARTLLERIVDGGTPTPEETELAARLRVPVRDRYVPFAVAIHSASPRRHAALAARLRTRGRLAVTEGDRVLGLAERAIELHELDEGSRPLLAVGGETRRTALAEARDELRLLVDHARRSGATGVVTPESHALELLLARSPRVGETLRERVLGPLARGGDGADLVRTLRTLVRCGFDRARTSAALHVHRNTLGYRIGRIEELTGLDLASPRDVARVYLALGVEAGGVPAAPAS
jgi:PucR-like helix-turn-helix protein